MFISDDIHTLTIIHIISNSIMFKVQMPHLMRLKKTPINSSPNQATPIDQTPKLKELTQVSFNDQSTTDISRLVVEADMYYYRIKQQRRGLSERNQLSIRFDPQWGHNPIKSIKQVSNWWTIICWASVQAERNDSQQAVIYIKIKKCKECLHLI